MLWELDDGHSEGQTRQHIPTLEIQVEEEKKRVGHRIHGKVHAEVERIGADIYGNDIYDGLNWSDDFANTTPAMDALINMQFDDPLTRAYFWGVLGCLLVNDNECIPLVVFLYGNVGSGKSLIGQTLAGMLPSSDVCYGSPPINAFAYNWLLNSKLWVTEISPTTMTRNRWLWTPIVNRDIITVARIGQRPIENVKLTCAVLGILDSCDADCLDGLVTTSTILVRFRHTPTMVNVHLKNELLAESARIMLKLCFARKWLLTNISTGRLCWVHVKNQLSK